MMRDPLQAPRQPATAEAVLLPVLVSEKLDGIRCIVNLPGAPTALTSRSGLVQGRRGDGTPQSKRTIQAWSGDDCRCGHQEPRCGVLSATLA